MALDAFLQFTKEGTAVKVEGETQDKYFKKPPNGGPAAFELKSWSFSAKNEATIGSATSGAGAGKATFDEFKVQKNVDTATPALFQTICAGGHYDTLTLWVRKPGGNKTAAGEPYLEWQFKMAFVSNITWSSGDTAPTEDVSFVYGAIRFSYKAQGHDGVLKKEQPTEWSQVLNAQTLDVHID
jgi:type VI secretion system secreted protein Hcp